MTRPPVGAQNKYRSRSSFSPLPWEDSYPSGLYTAIVHNGPLRTRIQDHLDEFEEFKAHLQRAQELFLGWIVTLYSLILVVAWNALVCAFLTSLGLIFHHPWRSLQPTALLILACDTFMLGSHGCLVPLGLNRQCHSSALRLPFIDLISRQTLGCNPVARDLEIYPRFKSVV